MLQYLYHKYFYKQPNFEEALGYKDVYLQQLKNPVNSRLDTDTSSEIIKGIRVKIPLIAANMYDTSSPEFIIELQKLGAFGILHRAMPLEDILNGVQKLNTANVISAASVGVGEEGRKLATALVHNNCRVICIDVAHGFSSQTLEIAKYIKKLSFGHTKLILGNTNNPKHFTECYKYIDAIKLGIGAGESCSTKDMTGCHEPTFWSIHKFKKLAKELGIPIIGDGGIRGPKDFCLGLAAGASSIMAGSIFAKCKEAPGESIFVGNEEYKTYSGMSSKLIQDKWKGKVKEGTCPEGYTKQLKVEYTAKELVNLYQASLRSSLTYCGSKNIKEMHKNARFIKVI